MNVTDCAEVIADFAGGPASGRQMPIQGDPDCINLPVCPDTSIAGFWGAAPSVPVAIPVAVYRRRGVRDDGRRVYAYDARLSTA